MKRHGKTIRRKQTVTELSGEPRAGFALSSRNPPVLSTSLRGRFQAHLADRARERRLV